MRTAITVTFVYVRIENVVFGVSKHNSVIQCFFFNAVMAGMCRVCNRQIRDTESRVRICIIFPPDTCHGFRGRQCLTLKAVDTKLLSIIVSIAMSNGELSIV